jgi:hypothetical protein
MAFFHHPCVVGLTESVMCTSVSHVLFIAVSGKMIHMTKNAGISLIPASSVVPCTSQREHPLPCRFVW